MAHSSLARGARHAIAAAAAFSVMSACAKAAATSGASNALLVFSRNVVVLIVLIPWLLKHGVKAVKTQRFTGHLWRSCFGLAAMYTMYYAIAKLPLAEALLLNSTSPIYIPLLAWLMLQEKPPLILIPTTIVGLIGIALIIKPISLGVSFASIIGAVSGLLAAAAMVSLRRISDTESPQKVVFYFGFIGLIISTPFLWNSDGVKNFEQLLYLLGTGFGAAIGQLQLTRAYAAAPAAQVSVFSYTSVVFAGILGWVIWNERPDALSVLGGALVVFACWLSAQTPRWRFMRGPVVIPD